MELFLRRVQRTVNRKHCDVQLENCYFRVADRGLRGDLVEVRYDYHSTQSQHDCLFRLTKSRFQPLWRQAELIDEDPTHKTYHLHW